MTNNIKIAQSIADQVAAGKRDFGRVLTKEAGKFMLLTYTNEAQYSGDFTEIEKACRGLVVNGSTGEIAALPMPKFFNLGEPQCPPLPDEPYEVWEKVDGSLGVFWYDGNSWRCNTRGSFDNDYTRFALDWWQEHVNDSKIPRHWTVMVEICFDDDEMNRAVQHREGLYLIAVRDNYSGIDLSLWSHGDVYKYLPHPDLPHASKVLLSVEQLVQRQKEAEGTEGWVIRFESGLRVKVKTLWYVRLFRAVQQLTPKNIRELMIEAGNSWLNQFPDDLRPQALEIYHSITHQFNKELGAVLSAYREVVRIENRKDYAIAVIENYKPISHWLFKLRDGKFNAGELLAKMDLAVGRAMAEAEVT